MLEKTGEFNRKNAGRIVLGAVIVLLILSAAVFFLRDGGKNGASLKGRMEYLRDLGWEADETTEETGEVLVPNCSEGAMADYNELMKRGGFDLSPYEGKSVEQFRYELTNYPDCSDTVYVVLYVSKGKVIGGDIHTAALDGFMHELCARETE